MCLLLVPMCFGHFLQFRHRHSDVALACTETKMDNQNCMKPRQEPMSSDEISSHQTHPPHTQLTSVSSMNQKAYTKLKKFKLIFKLYKNVTHSLLISLRPLNKWP